MYKPKDFEKKWQQYWLAEKTFKTENPQTAEKRAQKKAYVLDMFPYPSGAGLHVGHPKGYIATDIYSRYVHALGYNVLHPMGWDAFGLPAENYAIKTGTHPKVTTMNNINRYREQLQLIGLSYDWDREIDTTDPEYYKWTQWIFLKLFERGLAYEQDLPINYCPSCKTGLANEEVLADNTCDRCGTLVERRKIRQWVLAITKYADRLLSDIDALDWPEGIKEMQRNWIGKSEGCEFNLKKADDASQELSVYTTRIDTVFGMTYVVIAPDHGMIASFIAPEQREACESYIAEAKSKSDQDRTNEGKEKTGVFTGSYVINPFNGEKVPVWIADYVLGSYGTGAVMAVPAHDARDYEFARKYHLPINHVIIPDKAGTYPDPYIDDGLVINPLDSSGPRITSAKAREFFVLHAEYEGFGKKKVNYKLRDWLFSRQRYWGEPIPLVHIDLEAYNALPTISHLEEGVNQNIAYVLQGNPSSLVIGGKEVSKIYDGLYTKIICDYSLPLQLPDVERYEPAGDGQSPLANVPSFINVELAENLTGRRETNTMPQWGGSCWYYLRFMDPKNSEALVGKEAVEYWKNVDFYVGGAEHAVLHLLYARFWHKVLFDIGSVPTSEPFQRLMSPGLILGSDGNKMSKSKGNVVNPDAVIEEHGVDTFRLYEMSMSDFRDPAPWNTEAIVGVRRFLEKVEATFEKSIVKQGSDEMKIMKLLHKTIKKVGEDIENYKFNTAISALMILVNEGLPSDEEFQKEWKEAFVRLLHPFAPHIAEEIWQKLGNTESIYFASWPEYDDFMLVDDEVTIAIQVNGKLRGTFTFLNGVAQEEVSATVYNDPEIQKWINGKEIAKEIFVPNKLFSIVVKP